MTEILLSERDQGRVLEARCGDELVLRLEENLTTGYSWALESTDGVVELLESTYTENLGKAMGRGGQRVIRLQVKSPGSQDIYLSLRRPWEPQGRALRLLRVTVRVPAA